MNMNTISEMTGQAANCGPIDWVHLGKYTFGDKALESEVLAMFAEQAPVYLKDLADAPTPAAWQGAAHTLKGCARSVGSWRVAAAAEKAEMLWTTGQPASGGDGVVRKAALEILGQAVDEACVYIRDKLRKA
jgi:hypothetical protein